MQLTDTDINHGQHNNELKSKIDFSGKISILQQICCSDFDSIPSADNYLEFKPSATKPTVSTQPKTVTISYQGNYKVLEATDVNAIAQNLGNKVEIIGYIVGTKEGYTQGGGRRGNRPYVFVNFQDWRLRLTFRLVLWSEVLNQFRKLGVRSITNRYTGQYISIIGLVRKFGNKWGTSYQIIPDKASELQIIDKTEADFRLGKIKKTLNQYFGGTASVSSPSVETGSNSSKLSTILGTKMPPHGLKKTVGPPSIPRTSFPKTSAPSSSPVQSTNAGKLKTLQEKWGGSASSGSSSVNTGSATSIAQPVKPGGGCCLWLIGIIITTLLLGKLC